MATANNDTTMADVAPGLQGAHEHSGLLQTPHSDAFTFSETETTALELYDKLRELELETSLLEAHNAGMS
jgi:hypothetical protein